MEKKPYEWDFDSACAPGKTTAYRHQVTFSLGVFQWLPKRSGAGLKRGKVAVRYRGFVEFPENAYIAARAEVNRRNEEQRIKESRENVITTAQR